MRVKHIKLEHDPELNNLGFIPFQLKMHVKESEVRHVVVSNKHKIQTTFEVRQVSISNKHKIQTTSEVRQVAASNKAKHRQPLK